jgi:hypothetical protein
LLDAICGIEVLARKTHATMLELVAGLDASRVAGEQGFDTTSKLLAAMLDLSASQPEPELETPSGPTITPRPRAANSPTSPSPWTTRPCSTS